MYSAHGIDLKAQFLHIYQDITKKLTQLVKTFQTEIVAIRDEDLRNEAKKKISEIDGLRKEVDKSIKQLEQNSEWSNFTIAFYGETNAGKSTIIESLRLLLGEEGKKREHQKHEQGIATITYLNEQIAQKEQSFAQMNCNLQELNLNHKVLIQQTEQMQEDYNTQLQALNLEKNSLEQKLKQGNIWRIPILSIKRYLSQKKECKQRLVEIARQSVELQEKKLQNHDIQFKKIDVSHKQITQKQSRLKAVQRDISVLKEQIEQEMVRLDKYKDGLIMSDGQQDFTRDTVAYYFHSKEKSFCLLDLPGIEGEEEKVSEEIFRGLKRSHAVFYITRDYNPPQKGDEKSGGVLEKIQNHLGDQAMVYTICNCSITDAEDLNEPLQNPKCERALDELDQAMIKSLGKHYAGHLLLSALPAFLASAKYPRKEMVRKQQKFLKVFSASELLCRSGINMFADKLLELADSSKIKESNLLKIEYILHKAIEAGKQYRESLIKVYTQTSSLVKGAKKDVSKSTNEFEGYVTGVFGGIVNNIIAYTRKRCYDDIDKGIKDSLLQENFKKYLSSGRMLEKKKTKQEIENYAKEAYQPQLSQILKRLELHANDFSSRINCNLSVHSGDAEKPKHWTWEQTFKVGSIILGAGLAITFNAPWLAVAAVIGAIAKLGFIIYDLFHDKKKRQRDSIDKSLKKNKQSMEQEMAKTNALQQVLDEVIEQPKPILIALDNITGVLEQQQIRITQLIDFMEAQCQNLRRM